MRRYTYIWPGHHELVVLIVVTHYHTAQLTTELFQCVLQHVTVCVNTNSDHVLILQDFLAF